MALDSLTALANTGSGTDLLGGRTVGGKFVGAAMLTDETGAEISAANPLDVSIAALATSTPDPSASGLPVRQIGQETFNCSFADVGASLLSTDMTQLRLGTGMAVSQSGGNLVVTTGTSTNAEFLARSTRAWKPPVVMRHSAVLSQRIANNNFMYVLADLIGEGLAYTINSATSVSVTKTAHGFTATNVGQFMFLGGISGAAGIPTRYAIASIPDADTINFTVSAWPASGSGTLTLFGWNHVKTLYSGTTATNALADSQRKGWASGDTTLATLTSASPGHIMQTHLAGREVYWGDTLRASVGVGNLGSRGLRYENIPNEDADLYLFLWAYNGTVAPATTTTWTVSFVSVEKFAGTPVYIQGQELQGTSCSAPVQVVNTVPVSISALPALVASTARIGTVSSAGIWYDDSSATLAGAATFTGTSRDVAGTATATAWTVATVFAQETVVSAESDVTGTLWLEASRDNTNWRRIKSIATAAVTGGGFYAEIIHRPSWRYLRVGYTNGAGVQARFTIGTFMKAA